MHIMGYKLNNAERLINDIQSLPADRLLEWQNKRKWDIAKFHHEKNYFYRSKINGKFPNTWEDLPILCKSDYQSDFVKILSNGYSLKNIYRANTSGSSGTSGC